MKKIEFMPCDFCPDYCTQYMPIVEVVTTSDSSGSYTATAYLVCEHEEACAMHAKKPSITHIKPDMDDLDFEEIATKIAERFAAHISGGLKC